MLQDFHNSSERYWRSWEYKNFTLGWVRLVYVWTGMESKNGIINS